MHKRSHSSQKWSGDGNLGSLVSLSKGILPTYSKEIKKQSEQEGDHHQERNVDKFLQDRKQKEV